MSTMGHLGVAGRTARLARAGDGGAGIHSRPRGNGMRSLPSVAAPRGRAQTSLARRAPDRRDAGELEPSALTARARVLTIHRSKGSKRKDSRVDEEALIVWQDVLDMVLNGRPNEVACPHCNHRPLTIEEIEMSTRISCSKCGKFIQGRFNQ